MATNPADAIGALLADIANAVSQQALATDPVLRSRLETLEGSTIEIQCVTPPATWALHVTGGSLRLASGAAAAPRAVVRGTALALGSWLLPGPSDDVEIDGDALLLASLREILRDFAPDLATPLANALGSDTAATLLGTAELGLKSLQSALTGMRESLTTRSSAVFVQRPEFDELLDGIDTLRLRVDRLAARVRRHEDENRPDEP